MSSLLFSLLLLQVVHLSSSLQCLSNHDFTEGGIHVTMTKAHCYSNEYCAFVHFEDTKRPELKNGFVQGCDLHNIDCGTIGSTPGWTSDGNGNKCKNGRDFGNQGYICCCATENCNVHVSNPNPRPVPRPKPQFPYMLGFLTLGVIITVIIVVMAVICSRQPVKK